MVALPLLSWPLALLAAASVPPEIPCAPCHAEQTRQWQSSAHARAMGTRFTRVWKKQGNKWECLVCHTSDYDRKTSRYSTDGISCTSCHGVVDNHPAEGKMELPVSSEVCATCHKNTFKEWKLSRHGQKNIRCFDCHRAHGMDLRSKNPDAVCAPCHPARLKDFSHATHRIKNLHCVTCHMPKPDGSGTKIEGTGARGHSFGVGTNTCAQCHREMVHEGHDLISLADEVHRLKTSSREGLDAQNARLYEEVQAMRRSDLAGRNIRLFVAILAFVIGVAVGFVAAIILNRAVSNRRSRPPAIPPG